MADLNEARLEVILKLQDQLSSELKSALGKANSDVEKMKTGFNSAFGSMGDIARKFGIILGAAGIGLAFKQAIDAAVDFEKQFAEVRNTVSGSEKDFQQLSNNVIAMSKTMPVATEELNKIMAAAGQLGIKGVENITYFTQTIAKISAASGMSAEEATSSFARLSSVMNEPIGKLENMGSAVTALTNHFRASGGEITTFAERISGIGKTVGLSTADMLGMGAAVVSSGLNAERGAMVFNRALLAISQAVNDGGFKLEQFAKISGMTSEQFAKAFRDDAAKALAIFIQGLSKSGTEGAQVMKELDLADSRTVQSFFMLGGETGKLTKAIDLANKSFKDNSALADELAIKWGTTASQMQLFHNNVKALQITIGGIFLPLLNSLMPVLNNLTEGFGNFINILKVGMQSLGQYVTGIIAFVVGGLEKLTGLLSKVPFAAKEWKQYSESLREFRGELDNIGSAYKEGATQAAQSVIAQENAINTLQGATEDAKISTDGLGKSLEDLGKNAPAQVSSITDKLKDYKDELANTTNQLLNNQITAGAYFDFLINQQTAVVAGQQLMIKGMQDLAAAEMSFLSQSDTNRSKDLASATQLLNTIQSYQKTTWQTIFDFINKGLETFTTGFSKAISGIILGTMKASEAFKEFGKTLVTAIVEFIVQYAVQALIGATIGVMIAKITMGIANAIAAAWRPAAYYASVATFGGAAAAGAAALVGGYGITMGALEGLQTANKAASGGLETATLHQGGLVRAHTGLSSDEIMAVLQTGEGVLSRRGMRALGGDTTLNALNKGQNAGNTNNFNINVYASVNSKMDINELAEELGFEIERNLSRAKTIG